MKKKYLKPESLTVKIAHNLMLTLSETPAIQEGEVLGNEATFSDWGDEVNLSDWDEEKLSF